MAFFDKLSNVTKNAAAGAGDMIEITKLKAKIVEENHRAEGLKDQLGELYWQKAQSGQELTADAMELINQIREAYNQVDALNSEIAAIKASGQAAPAQAASAPSAAPQEAAEETPHCPNCGAVLVAGAKFCAACGQAIPQEKTCPACGKSVEEGVNFCPSCGQAL